MSLTSSIKNILIPKISEAHVFLLITILLSLGFTYRYRLLPIAYTFIQSLNQPDNFNSNITLLGIFLIIISSLGIVLYQLATKNISSHPKQQASIVCLVNFYIGVINFYALFAFRQRFGGLGQIIFIYQIAKSITSFVILYSLFASSTRNRPYTVSILSNQMKEAQISYLGLGILISISVLAYLALLQVYTPIITASFSYFLISIVLALKPLHKIFYITKGL